MQHVYGHTGNLGNECADHAAALGTLGLTSSRNVVTSWIRNNFDASVCFDGCNNISEVLERLQHIRTDATSLPQKRRYLKMRLSAVFTIGFIVFLVLLTCIFVSSVILLCAWVLGSASTLFFRTSNGEPFFVCLYRVELW